MKLCTKCKILKKLEDFNKDKRTKDGYTTTCKNCSKEVKQRYALKTRDKQKQYRQEHKDRISSYMKNYRDEHRESAHQNNKKWRSENPERCLENARRWRAKNIEHMREYKSHSSALRRAKLQQAVPPWADLEKIKVIYKKRCILSKEMGETYHVDHVIPLTGKNVCGLHVENNLQILHWKDNLKKFNSFSED